MITEIVGGCGYVSFSWTDSSSGMCTDYYYYYVTWSNRVTNMTAFISAMQYNLTDQPDDALIDITVYAALQSDPDRTPTSNVASTSVRTLPFESMYIHICTYAYIFVCMCIMYVYTNNILLYINHM